MNIDNSASGHLPHLGVLRFAGPDAVSFLQGQLSNDTRLLGAGSTLLAAYSSPQGRVVAVLRLLPHSTGVLAVLPAEIVLPTLERLRKFVMRAKVTIEDVSDRFGVIGQHGVNPLRAAGLDVPANTDGAIRTYVEYDGIGIARIVDTRQRGQIDGGATAAVAATRNSAAASEGGNAPVATTHDSAAASEVGNAPVGTPRDSAVASEVGDAPIPTPCNPAEAREIGIPSAANRDLADGYEADAGAGRDAHRYWIIGSNADLEARGFAPNGADSEPFENAWRLADIRAGLPQVYAATREMFVAQMLNLDLLDGISFTKGCFTGQEIIARTQHLGRIKRRLFRLRLPAGTWAIGQAIHLSDGRSGRLTELADAADGVEALAVLTLDAGAAEADSAAGTLVNAVELPLPYELVSGG